MALLVRFKDPEMVTRWPIIEIRPVEGSDEMEAVVVGEHVGEPGEAFEFEYTRLYGGRYMVDFDPGPEMRGGFYSEDEFQATFTVIEE